jgi:uncharacterized membrane protein YcaP (DUF421 family)
MGSQISDFFDAVLGLSLKSEQLGYGHMAARAFLMYLALIVIVRSAKKRFLSRATAFDFVLAVLIGAVAARAMTGGAPYFPSLLALMVLVCMHWAISAVTRDWPGLSKLIKGSSTLLVKRGQVDERALRASHMSMDDLKEDLREKGVADPSQVEEARLERSGKLSTVKK